MKGAAPKGSYHNYCRSNNTAKSPQNTHRVRSVRSHSTKQSHPIQEFQDFETYLRFLQQKEKIQAPDTNRPKTTSHRSALTSRPTTQVAIRSSNCNDELKEKTDLIKPYFPFFKCRIESQTRTQKMQAHFRLRDKKFKLNYRIIEQNMGKGDSSHDIEDF